MEISKLKTLATPNLNDVLPILDINGGLGGKPILRKATLSSLLALADISNNSQESSSFSIPSTTKTVAASTDSFIGIDSQGIAYKISKADLLAGLSSNGSSGGSTGTGNTVTDSQLSKVILLLKGIGANNSTNIIDSSSKAMIPTRLGDPIISTAKSKFDSTSIYFNNSSGLDYSSLDFNFAGDFTIDFWFLSNDAAQSNNGDTLLDMRPDQTNGNYPVVSIGQNKLQLYQNGNIQIQSSPVLANDAFYYAGLKRFGNDTQLWLNGSLVGVYTSGIYSNSSRLLVGCNAYRNLASDTYFYGYISGFRVTNSARDLSVIPTQSFPAS